MQIDGSKQINLSLNVESINYVLHSLDNSTLPHNMVKRLILEIQEQLREQLKPKVVPEPVPQGPVLYEPEPSDS